jgi:hypothetical protein
MITSLLAIQYWLTKWQLKSNSLNPHIPPLPLVQQHVLGSKSTSNIFPKQKKLSILGFTWTWHKQIFAEGQHLGITLSKMYWLLGLKPQTAYEQKLLAIKSSSNPSGPTEYNSWAQLPSPTSKYWNASKGKSCA